MYSRQNLRISFPPPGFFLVDTRTTLSFDGQVVYDGSFKQGFNLDLPVTPGEHLLTTTIELPPLKRSRQYTLSVRDGEALSVVLRYSRFWGNFDEKLSHAGAPDEDARFRWGRAAIAFLVASPAAMAIVFVVAVRVSPPFTSDGHAVMAVGQALIALVMGPIVGVGAAFLVGRLR